MNLLGVTEKFTSFIIRPPRCSYNVQQLGPEQFQFKGKKFKRKDFAIKNHRNFKILGSLYKLKGKSIRPVIIFLHGNSSSRLAVKTYITSILPDFDLVAFDFSGSGQSDGKYITLGYEEKQDVHCVIKYLYNEYHVKDVIIWGRSMGAATALLYASKYCKKQDQKSQKIIEQLSTQQNIQTVQNEQKIVKCLILDSSFSNLQKLIKQFSENIVSFMPNFLIEKAKEQMQQYIQNNVWESQRTDFSLYNMNILEQVSKISTKMNYFFIASKDDKLIKYDHTKQLYEKISTEYIKEISIISGGHNDIRTFEFNQTVIQFIKSNLKFIKIQNKIVNYKTNLLAKQFNSTKLLQSNHNERQSYKPIILTPNLEKIKSFKNIRSHDNSRHPSEQKSQYNYENLSKTIIPRVNKQQLVQNYSYHPIRQSYNSKFYQSGHNQQSIDVKHKKTRISNGYNYNQQNILQGYKIVNNSYVPIQTNLRQKNIYQSTHYKVKRISIDPTYNYNPKTQRIQHQQMSIKDKQQKYFKKIEKQQQQLTKSDHSNKLKIQKSTQQSIHKNCPQPVNNSNKLLNNYFRNNIQHYHHHGPIKHVLSKQSNKSMSLSINNNLSDSQYSSENKSITNRSKKISLINSTLNESKYYKI